MKMNTHNELIVQTSFMTEVASISRGRQSWKEYVVDDMIRL